MQKCSNAHTPINKDGVSGLGMICLMTSRCRICLTELASGAHTRRACAAHMHACAQAAPCPLQQLRLNSGRLRPMAATIHLAVRGIALGNRKRPVVADPAPAPLPARVPPPPPSHASTEPGEVEVARGMHTLRVVVT